MSTKPKKKLFVPIAVAVVVLLVAALAIGLFLATPVAKVEEVITGTAIDAKPGSLTVKEEYSMQMKSEIAGRVLKDGYRLEPGLEVNEGDILVKLDTSSVEIAIDQAKSNLKAAEQKLTMDSAYKSQIETAQSDLKNTERLFNMGQVSDSEYQKARRLMETLQTQMALEKINREQDYESDKNALRELELKRDKMTIKAPFDGVVSIVFAHPGDLIDVGSPIMAVITKNRLVEAKISEEDFANIRVGQNASVTFIPYGAWIYHGVVHKILPTADPETQRHLVDIDVTDIEPNKLIPGITGEVAITVGVREAKAIIPRRALVGDNVYVVKDGHIELRHVEKGYMWLTGAEITKGLEAGELVVVEDLDTLRPGQRVRTEVLPVDAISKKK